MMKLEMPALSPTMENGTIAKWNKKEGDKVDIGDVMCEVTTDKATVGYESQEEGYIAKILSQEGAVVPIGHLIGIMVEEKEDIGGIDLSSVQQDAPKAQEAPKVEVPTPVAAASAPGTDSWVEEFNHVLHSGAFKVAPSAGWWMRTYMVMPSELSATGPKGFILKSDVLAHIEKNKLVKGQRKEPAVSKKPAAKKAAPKKEASPAVDPNDPFQQTWTDNGLDQGFASIAASIKHQKQYVAHTYMSSKVNVTSISPEHFSGFLLKAASKSFIKVFN